MKDLPGTLHHACCDASRKVVWQDFGLCVQSMIVLCELGEGFSWVVVGERRKEPKGYMPFGEGPRKCLGMLLAKCEMRVSGPSLRFPSPGQSATPKQ
jgi:hypothetical protein